MTAALRLSEQDWQTRVTDYAALKGWAWIHVRPARTVKGWRTPVSGPLGAGWPDLILVRDGRLVAIELKSASGRLTGEQRTVLAALSRIPGVDTMVARPCDWGTVQEVLS